MLILYNSHIYTQDAKKPFAQAMAIEGEKILAVGTNDEILRAPNLVRRKLGTTNPQFIDLHGQTVWPGLTDAHLHLQSYAEMLSRVDCETESKQECLKRVAKRAQETPPGEWILGHGWNQNLWPEGFGSAADLDSISNQHPIYLTAKSLHAGWANSFAMQLCGISSDFPDPKGGIILRNAAGEPTGILLEMAAMKLVSDRIPPPTPKRLEEIIELAQTALWRMGITGVHDFDPPSCLSALQSLHFAGRLRLRVLKGIAQEHLIHALALGLKSGFGDDWLRVGSLKLFSDGALGPHTAAMLAPYEDDPKNTGMLLLTKEQILEYGIRASSIGMSLAIHAIGDRANREGIDGLTSLREYEQKNSLPHLRHRIEHVQLLDPLDIPRLAKYDLIASMQPIHAPSDQDAAETFWGSRCQGAYAWRSLADHKTRLCFGSDAPVESPNPFFGLGAAVTRQLPGADRPQWRPEQSLTLQEALHGFTLGPAYAAGMETRLGRLTSGYLADLIVLSQDPFSLPPDELSQILPSATMVGGEWVLNNPLVG